MSGNDFRQKSMVHWANNRGERGKRNGFKNAGDDFFHQLRLCHFEYDTFAADYERLSSDRADREYV